jgi:transposase
MAQFTPKAGIDSSVDWLDVHLYPLEIAFRVSNDAPGWRELHRRLRAAQVEIVALEASGGCERAACHFLLERGYSVRLLDALRVRQFAKATGKLAKNDRIDAEVIAHFVAVVATRPMVRDRQRERLAELVGARAQLTDHLTLLRNQAHGHREALLCRLDRQRVARVQADIRKIERRIAEVIAADPDMTANNALLRSMKAVGPVLAFTLQAFLPELGHLTRKQIAALAGVAPFEDQSGKRQGVRYIQGGRASVRGPLYMAALVAARYNPILMQTRDRLRALNKKPKVVIVALMRRMLTILNAILRDGIQWQNKAA